MSSNNDEGAGREKKRGEGKKGERKKGRRGKMAWLKGCLFFSFSFIEI